MNTQIIILFLCQALFWCSVIVGVALSSLVGAQIAPSIALATLPLATLTLGNIVSTYPLSQLMQRYGRKIGFMMGAAASILGGYIACYAIHTQNFWLFCFANALLGIAQASALYYRLAATDSVDAQSRGKAISWVMSGGILAALVAPSLAVWSKDIMLPHVFAGSYALVGVIGFLTLVLCFRLKNQTNTANDNTAAGRPLIEIIKQPTFIVAISNAGISHGVMVLIMVATPLAMMSCGYGVSDSAHVIQWHVLGMFLPSFFSGKLVDKLGAPITSFMGISLLIVSSIIATADIQLINFYVALFLLGTGWNLMYTAGTSLIAASHTASERGKVQGAAELIISILAALAAFGSGALLHQFNWTVVNIGSLPLLITAAAITTWYLKNKRKAINT